MPIRGGDLRLDPVSREKPSLFQRRGLETDALQLVRQLRDQTFGHIGGEERHGHTVRALHTDRGLPQVGRPIRAQGPLKESHQLDLPATYLQVDLGNEEVLGLREGDLPQLAPGESQQEHQPTTTAAGGKIEHPADPSPQRQSEHQKDTSIPMVGRIGNIEMPVRTGGVSAYSKK